MAELKMNPTTVDMLEEHRDALARSLKAQEAAGESLAAARKRYDEKVAAALEALKQQLEEENQEITDALNAATKAKLEADNQARDQRETIKAMLLDYTTATDREDKKPVDGFARRDSLEPYWHKEDTGDIIQQLAAHAPFLLKPDEKAIATFVKAFAEDTTYPQMPMQFAVLVPALRVRRKYTWTISDKTVIKHAPADETPAPATEEV